MRSSELKVGEVYGCKLKAYPKATQFRVLFVSDEWNEAVGEVFMGYLCDPCATPDVVGLVKAKPTDLFLL